MSARDNGFTFQDSVSLKEYFESRLRSVEQAIGIAANLMDKRLDTMNEIREQLKDQAARFITRDELNARLAVFDADIRTLREAAAKNDGKVSMGSVYLAVAIALLGIAVGIAGIVQ